MSVRSIVACGLGAGLLLWAGAVGAQVTYTVKEVASPGGPIVTNAVAMNSLGHVSGEAARGAYFWDGTTVRDIRPPGAEWSEGLALNDRDQVVVWGTRNLETRGWRWTSGTLEPIGGDALTMPKAINSVGTVVGTWYLDGFGRGFTFDGSLHALQTTPGTSSEAVAINDAGTVAGWAQLPGDNRMLPALWVDGALENITVPGSPMQAELTALDAAGHAIGATNDAERGWRAFRWVGHVEMLETLGAWSVANALNDAGQIVGNSRAQLSEHERAVLWNGTSIADLHVPGSPSSAADINADGTIVGNYWSVVDGWTVFVWDGEVHRLQDLVDPADPMYGRLRFDYAIRLNDAGQILVSGILVALGPSSSDRKPYVLTPSVPRYAFGGFQTPIEAAPAINVVRAGSAVPVKFTLGGDRGIAIFAPGYPAVVTAGCTDWTMGSERQPADSVGGGLRYDATTDSYTFVWKTGHERSGTCVRLELRFADGSATRSAMFRFR